MELHLDRFVLVVIALDYAADLVEVQEAVVAERGSAVGDGRLGQAGDQLVGFRFCGFYGMQEGRLGLLLLLGLGGGV
jgi:hypothetical protein